MAGMQFEYDEEGGTFFYFLLSFWALILIPCTYFFWPVKEAEVDKDRKKCNCPGCVDKRDLIARERATLKPTLLKIVFIIGWIIFALLAWKVSMIQLDHVEYDPFLELEIDRGSSAAEIKRAYRKLSLIYHPDRETGDPKKFMRIAKAYAALTDDESRKNWEEFGNPDGPEATRFGIALPKWIIERENSMWVLAVYGLVFIVLLPIVVGVWWYRSIKFSGDQVLLDTTRLYYYFFNKTQLILLKRVVMILAASCEFDRAHNAEIIERMSDNEELPMLFKHLNNLQEKNKERPLCFGYSIKARCLLLAHFQGVPLNPQTLSKDQRYILKKCPYLLNEMVNICAGLVAMAMSGRVSHRPHLMTIENIMKASQMLIQGLDERSSPLEQLPHIRSDMMRNFVNKKRNIRGVRSMAAMKDEDRRAMLRELSDEEYADVLTVLGQLPQVKMTVHVKVLDEEDDTITAGSIVTVSVQLVRQDMEVLFNKSSPAAASGDQMSNGDVVPADGEEEEDLDKEEEEDKKPSKAVNKPWKQRGQKKKGAKPKKKVKQVVKKAVPAPAPLKEASESGSPKAVKSKSDPSEEGDDNSDDENMSDDDTKSKPKKTAEKEEVEEEEDEDWDSYKMESKKENSLDTKKKESHIAHCPYFPGDKQEGWWLFVADRKQQMLITAPVHVCTLKDEEEVQLKFSAPHKPGHYQFIVILKSDAYFGDFDQSHNIKFEVKEAKIVEDHPQWDISEDEDDKENDDDDDESDDEDDSDYNSEDDSD